MPINFILANYRNIVKLDTSIKTQQSTLYSRGESVAWEGTRKSVIVYLNELKSGEKGIVQQIDGGRLLMDRLNALGIRPGKEILKISSMFTNGPVTIQIDRTQIAIGLGMAKKILINTGRTEK